MGWGDEVMVTGQVRVMQARDPRRVRIDYGKPLFSAAFHHNPRIAEPHERGDFQILQPRPNGLRPYTVSKSPQRWIWQRYTPPVGELYLTAEEQEFAARYAGRVIVEPHNKPGASPNKAWGWVRWNKLAWLLGRRGIAVSQMGPDGTPVLEGVDLIHTPSLRHAAAVLALARAAVLPEGGLHHTAAVFGVPAVVIYGGFISPEVTGYAGQVALFHRTNEHPLGCGYRTPCAHCRAAMAAITPEQVADQLEALIGKRHQAMVGAVAA